MIKSILIAMLLATCLELRAQLTNAAPNSGFEAFHIVVDRNIFNPSRSPRGSRGESRDAAKAVRTESFALVGTMLYEKGRFAFFDGSSSQYKKVLSPSDQIAGYTVTEIEANRVKLETNGHPVELTVGQQMKREDEGEWTLSATRDNLAKPSADSSSSSEVKAAPGEDADILKRLQQKREAELKK